MSKSVCFDRSSHLTAATLLKSPRCRIFNPTHLKRLARIVRGCAPRNQEIPPKCLSRITGLRTKWARSLYCGSQLAILMLQFQTSRPETNPRQLPRDRFARAQRDYSIIVYVE